MKYLFGILISLMLAFPANSHFDPYFRFNEESLVWESWRQHTNHCNVPRAYSLAYSQGFRRLFVVSNDRYNVIMQGFKGNRRFTLQISKSYGKCTIARIKRHF